MSDRSARPEAGTDEPTRPARGRRRLIAALAALVVVVGIGVVVLERATKPEPSPAPPASSSAPSAGGGTRVALPDFGPYPTFGPASIYKADVSAAPLAADGAAKVAYLAKTVAANWGGISPINVDKYGAGYAVAAADTPKTDVKFVDCQKKGATPAGLYDGPKYFAQVPIPPDAVPAPGSDGHLAIYDPTQDRLWEFWVAQQNGDGWQACWGGRIDGVNAAKGQFAPPYGVGATGLATAGYMITLQDAKQNRIDHAMGLVVMEAAPGHSYPANRDDGTSGNPAALQEGTRLRLDPSVDVDALALAPLGKAVARAAQKYGFIVCDKGGAVAVMAETGDRWRKQLGVNPWSQLASGGEAYQALKGFPWDKVQVVQRDWGRPG